MRPLRVPTLPNDNSKWLYEPKLDGYRAIALKNGGRPTLYSMDGQVYDRKFPNVFDALSKIIHKDFVLDGELVALEPSGRPNFNELQNHQHTDLPIFYIALTYCISENEMFSMSRLKSARNILQKLRRASLHRSSPFSSFPKTWIYKWQFKS